MSMTKNDSHDACLRFTSRYIKALQVFQEDKNSQWSTTVTDNYNKACRPDSAKPHANAPLGGCQFLLL